MFRDGAEGLLSLAAWAGEPSPRTSRPASSGACPRRPSRSARPKKSCLFPRSPRRSSGSFRPRSTSSRDGKPVSFLEVHDLRRLPAIEPLGAFRMSTDPVLTQHKVTVLLIDDQPMIGEAVRRMLAGEPDIDFHYNRDAATALERSRPGQAHGDPSGSGHARDRRPDPGQEVPGQRADPRDAADRALDQGRAGGQGRGVRARGQRLHRQASGPARAAGENPLSLQGLHHPAPAQRGVPGTARRASTGWPTR